MQILMPGVDQQILRGLTANAPCLLINGEHSWWNNAVYAAVPIPRRPD
jgi:hypothetical protein